MAAKTPRVCSEDLHLKELLSITEFGFLHGQGRTKTYALLRSGALKGVRVGRRTMIPKENAKAWKESLPAYVSTATEKD